MYSLKVVTTDLENIVGVAIGVFGFDKIDYLKKC